MKNDAPDAVIRKEIKDTVQKVRAYRWLPIHTKINFMHEMFCICCIAKDGILEHTARLHI